MIKYNKPKTERINRYFIGVQVEGMWWHHGEKRWIANDDVDWEKGNVGNICTGVHTIRALRKHLKNHPEIQNRAIYFTNRFVGFDVWVKENFYERTRNSTKK